MAQARTQEGAKEGEQEGAKKGAQVRVQARTQVGAQADGSSLKVDYNQEAALHYTDTLKRKF